ncbi:MAG: CotH kinase family protein [Kiritimatiellia bacterium]|jgi:hypothetical protein
MKRKRIARCILLVVFAGAALAWLLSSDALLFDRPETKAREIQTCIGERLSSRHRVAFYASFDEPHPRESVHRTRLICPDTRTVPGRFGRARKINGESSSYIRTAVFWDVVKSPSYALSFWVKVQGPNPDQEIWHTQAEAASIGFQLEQGRMTFHVPGTSHMQQVSYPFDSFNRFVHLATVVDGPSRTVRLYEDGALKAEASVDAGPLPHRHLEFGCAQWNAFRGCIDEAALWNRALSDSEVRSLARARRSLPARLEPWKIAQLRIVEAYQRIMPTVLASFHKLNPAFNPRLPTRIGIPEVSLRFSKSDSRHFIRAHEESKLSGQRTDRAAKSREIIAKIDGKIVNVEACLDDAYDVALPTRRPAFVLQTLPGTKDGDIEPTRLYPPETYSLFHPDSPFPAPLGTNGLVRLVIDGVAKGIYCTEPADRLGGAWLIDDARSRRNAKFPLRNAWGGTLGETWRLTPEAQQEARKRIQHLLSCDFQNPCSHREWSWRIRHQEQRFVEARFVEHGMTAFDIMGRNPSPFHVVENLDLAAAGTHRIWRSDNPDVIDSQGRVKRPAGDLPVEVEMTATTPDGTTETLRFRVVPERPRLPVLMLYVNQPLSKVARRDFSAVFHPAGGEGAPRRLTGRQSTGGGIKHRGNTSYLKAAKKAMSLRFDKPHHLFTETDTRHLYLLSGYADDTRMRNKLSYDLFRSFAAPGQPRHAPEMAWAEVFVNGDYYGVFEVCTRVHGCELGAKDKPDDPRHTPLLFKIRQATHVFANANADAFEPILPGADDLSRRDALLGLLTFTARADTETFRRDIARHIDVDNLVDFILLLNFTGNEDGRISNFYLARGADEGSPFFFIPWDYDKTFNEPFRVLSNSLIDRMRNEVAGFNDKLSRRWAELRAGELSEQAIDARISRMEDALAGYMDWEYDLQNPPEGTPRHGEAVAELRRITKQRLSQMDALFEKTTDANPAQ